MQTDVGDWHAAEGVLPPESQGLRFCSPTNCDSTGEGGEGSRSSELVDPHAIAEELVEVDRQRDQFRHPGETGCIKICYHPQDGSGLMHLSMAQFDCYVASPFLVG